MTLPALPEPSGVLVAVVGPSGAGKDTVLAGVRPRLPKAHFSFPRRIITRQPGPSEDSQYLSEPAFRERRLAGDFLIAWEAHGLHYAIPSAALDELEVGRHVIANLSRAAIPALRSKLRRVLVVHITADPAVIEDRLRRRGREFGDDQKARLSRGLALDAEFESDLRIENNGPAEDAITSLAAALLRLPMRQMSETSAS